MNRIKAKITAMSSSGNLSLVTLTAGSQKFTSVILDTTETSPFIALDETVNVLFKETEVIIGKGDPGYISLRNRIPGKISGIEKGQLLGRILIQTEHGMIRSMITANAIEELQLSVGDEVFAMIKTNELMLSQE